MTDSGGAGGSGDKTRTRVWRAGVLAAEDFPLAEISDHIARGDCIVWADICSPDEHLLRTVADELNLDPLAIEDAVSRHERPKADRYRSHLFVNTYAVDLDVASGALRTAEVSAFVLPRALLTVRRDDWFGTDRFVSRWDENPDLMKYGVSALLYGLLDVIVDGHFEAVQTLDGEIETLEDELFEERPHGPEVQRRTFAMRKSLVHLRKLVLPTREVVNTLMRRDLKVMDEAMVPYYQDLYDHVLRATEWTESLRDLVTTIFETNLSLQDARLNNVVKKLSAWAAIIAVPTAITGYYGQNLPYPGYQHWSGYLTSTLVTIVIAGAIYLAFRRRGWL